MSKTTPARYTYIDAIRGFAALGVIYFHASLESISRVRAGGVEYALFWSATALTDLGKICVILFFMVSGLVVPFSLLRPGNKPRDFIISRFFRLYPAYWLCIAASLITIPIFHQQLPSKLDIITNISMMQSFIGQANIQGLFWTLQIELIFYAICLGMFVLGHLQKLRSLVAAAAAAMVFAALLAIGRHATGHALPVALPLSIAVMFFGMVWRRHVVDGEDSAKHAAYAMISGFALTFPWIAFLAYGTEGAYPPAWLRYILTYAIAIGLFVLLTTRFRIRWRVGAYLGKISYSVYLFGAFGQNLIERLFPAIVAPGVIAHWLILASLAFAIAIASVTYAIVEEPAIRTGRRVVTWLDGRRAGNTATEVI